MLGVTAIRPCRVTTSSRKEDDCASRYAATRVPRAGNFRK